MTMPSLPSLNKRRLYSLLLKLLTLLGVVIIMSVMINSLWGTKGIGGTVAKKKAEIASVIQVSLKDLKQGNIQRVNFNGQSVSIVYRADNELESDAEANSELNGEWRSIKREYFIFINQAGPTRCPLHLSANAKELKDICSGVIYDSTGRNRGSNQLLIIPPHYFANDGELFIGSWKEK